MNLWSSRFPAGGLILDYHWLKVKLKSLFVAQLLGFHCAWERDPHSRLEERNPDSRSSLLFLHTLWPVKGASLPGESGTFNPVGARGNVPVCQARAGLLSFENGLLFRQQLHLLKAHLPTQHTVSQRTSTQLFKAPKLNKEQGTDGETVAAV